MITRVHDLNTIEAGDVLVVERYHIRTQLANYLYERPWRVEHVYGTGQTRRLGVIGLNKTDINRTVGHLVPLTMRMLKYAKIYQIIAEPEVLE